MTLFIYIDESGNFDFSPTGTKHFALTAFSTFYPAKPSQAFFNLKCKLLAQGVDIEYFHATEDKQAVRNQVFKLVSNLKTSKAFSVIIKKASLAKNLKEPDATYQYACLKLLDKIFSKYSALSFENVVIIMGSVFSKRKHIFIKRTVKKFLRKIIKKTFSVYFHQTKSDINSQLA